MKELIAGMSSAFESLRSKNQDALFAFLLTDLDLGFTFVDMARAGLVGDHRQKQKALEVVSAVKRFRGRLDPDMRRRVDVRLAELERAISML